MKVNRDVQGLIEYAMAVPKGRPWDSRLNRLDTLVGTMLRGDEFVPIQLQEAAEIAKKITPRALGICPLGMKLLQRFAPQKAAEKVALAVQKHLTETTMACWSPWMPSYKPYFPESRKEKVEKLLQRTATLQQMIASRRV